MGKFICNIFPYFCQLFDYGIKFAMTGSGSGAGDWSEVYSIQPYVIVCNDWRHVRCVPNTTLCNRVLMTGGRSEVYSSLNTTLCDRVCDNYLEAGQRCTKYSLM
jgi:hypothetical protein